MGAGLGLVSIAAGAFGNPPPHTPCLIPRLPILPLIFSVTFLHFWSLLSLTSVETKRPVTTIDGPVERGMRSVLRLACAVPAPPRTVASVARLSLPRTYEPTTCHIVGSLQTDSRRVRRTHSQADREFADCQPQNKTHALASRRPHRRLTRAGRAGRGGVGAGDRL